nr:glycoside hydrolase family 6 protein [Paenibacillus sp. YYML68]
MSASLVGQQSVVAAEAHVENPFLGATAYINPDYAALIDTSIAQVSDASLKAQMNTIKSYPTAVWLDRRAAIHGGAVNAGRLSLKEHMDAVLAQKKPGTPITAQFVIYNLPGRDCHALASNGELPLTQQGLNTYKTEYIDEIIKVLANPKYQDIRIVTIIEPDSLPNLVTNLSDQRCAQAASSGIYMAGVQYALDKLHAIPNVYTYLDIGHSGWLGWDNNRKGTVQLYTNMAKGTKAGFASVDGFVTNTSNTTPLVEPNLTDPTLTIGGQPIRSSKFYEWNSYFDEADFTAALYQDFVDAGWPAGTGFLIDTSRNGWGGPNRPTGASGSDINSYVNSGRVDRRDHRGLWCNVSGSGLGMPPQAAPSAYGSHLDALVWVKPPGESDGASSAIPNDEGKGFDRMCDPTYKTPEGVMSGALPNAPLAGHWFHDQFVMLVQNAYPVVPGGNPTDPGPVKPAAPTGVAATAGNAQASISWGTVSGAVTYIVKRSETAGGPYVAVATGVSATSFVNTGLVNDKTYYYVVSAVNSAGESANSQQVSATPKSTTTPPPPLGNIVLQYRAGDTNAMDSQMKPQFNVKNTGTTPVALSDLKIRYYFTKDGSAAMSSWIDWAQVGGQHIQRTITDSYVELSFAAGAGSIAAGGQTGDIQLRMASSDWSNLDETNDYSYDGTKTSYTSWNKVTVYKNGELVWGMEP